MRTTQQFSDVPMAPQHTMEAWLRNQVGPAHDALTADPGRARSLEQVYARLAAERNAA